MTDLVPVDQTAERSLFDRKPRELIAYAKEIAEPLADLIEKQKLYTVIQGKKYVRCEGWTTLGAMLGVVPRETSVLRHDDGSYTAHVDLIKFSTGQIVGGASALCDVSEKRWGGADDFARRSMAITRATGKAFRLGFSWIITLAGYEATPEEEIQDTKPAPKPYTGDSAQQRLIADALRAQKIPEEHWAEIDLKMMGKYSRDLPRIVKEVVGATKKENPAGVTGPGLG